MRSHHNGHFLATRIATVALGVACCVGTAGSLAAQDSDSPAAGTRVRVHILDGSVVTGTLIRLGQDTVRLRELNFGEVAIARSLVRRIEVPGPPALAEPIVVGALLGAPAGAIAGFLFARVAAARLLPECLGSSAACADIEAANDEEDRRRTTQYIIAGTVMGAVVGAVLNAGRSREGWTKLPLDARLDLTPSFRSGVAARVRLQF